MLLLLLGPSVDCAALGSDIVAL